MSIKRLLIVEDEVMVSDFLSELMKTQGYLISVVRSGRELYALLSSPCAQVYSLIITDINLPEYFGDEAVEMARCFTTKRPTLFISGLPKPPSVAEEVFLSKPFTKEELFAKINFILGENKNA